MARVSNDVDVRQLVGINAKSEEILESVDWVITNCAPDFAYQDGKKTDTIMGTTVLLSGPRKGDKLVRNRELKVKIDDVWSVEQCKRVNDVMPLVHIKINKATVWGKSAKDSEFVQINLSLHVTLVNEDGEVLNPDKVTEEE